MKFGSTPPPLPDDDAADPLLAALRQRLGDYGQAPPPAAWAAIRQQIRPVALPRPWWRRPSHLLPALGLLLGWLLPGMLGEPLQKTGLSGWLSGDNLATQSINRPAVAATSGELVAPQRRQVAASATAGPSLASHPLLGSAGAGRSVVTKEATAPTTRTNRQALATTTTPAAARRPKLRATPSETTQFSATATPDLATTTHMRHRAVELALADNNRRIPVKKRANLSPSTTNGTDKQPTSATKSPANMVTVAIPNRRRARNETATSQLTQAASSASAVTSETDRCAAARRLAQKDHSSSRARLAARRQARQSDTNLPELATTQESGFARIGTAATRPLARHDYAALPLLEPADSLALKQTSLFLPASALPPVLVARPDSNTSVAHPVRRWSLLVVAGPTLSYRTLGPAPTLAAGHPDFARLERPALGLGAQVQVRRVLSGRWAVAVGMGYHEYATRLALAFKDTVASVHQLDTYRLLTVPVQFSYALGVPKGRLTTALLLGTEPGWYMGGRSTEGADCGCQQQAYSATGSPYRTWSLAFSLGLDLRYRVGGPNSRWQWLVQPTGRYVATSFVRSDAVGFTRRQPWSLGLLTGFSWDVR